jgi:hypothetical protein
MTELRAMLLLVVLATTPLAAQHDPASAPLRLGDYLLNLPTTQTVPEGIWDLRFSHRFAQPMNQGDVHSLWGLDGPADIGIGLAYGLRQDLQLAIFRSDVLDNWELSAKYAIREQTSRFPVALSARGGANVHTEHGIEERNAPFAQLIVARRVNPRLELFAVPTWSMNAMAYDSAFNVPFGVAWALRSNLTLVAEVIPENSDAPEELGPGTGWAIGMKRAVGGHFFELLVCSSRATHVDQYTGSVPLGGIDEGNLHLGFNIGRRFGGRR